MGGPVLPSALPFIVTGIRLAIGRALIGVIVAEFYTALSGLGDLIATSANAFQTAACSCPSWSSPCSRAAHRPLEWAERRLARWRATAA